MKNAIIDIIIMKWAPTISAFITFLGLGGNLLGFIWALFVALCIRIILNFFEEEVRGLAQYLRKRWDAFRLRKNKK